MEKIGPVLFMHGGVATFVNILGYPLRALNQLCRPWYFTPELAPPVVYELLSSSDSSFWNRGYATGDARWKGGEKGTDALKLLTFGTSRKKNA